MSITIQKSDHCELGEPFSGFLIKGQVELGQTDRSRALQAGITPGSKP